MDFETNLRESFLKPNMMKDDNIPFGVPSSQGLFLQDFHHNIDQFHHVNGSSLFNPNISGVQTQNFDPNCDNFAFMCSSSAGFDVHEFKPFVDQNSSGHAYVMDNFLYGGYGLNLNPQKNNQLEMMVANQSNYYLPFNPQQDITKPVNNFMVPDEVSCISPVNYYKNNRASYPTRGRKKIRKKSNIVKGQWTVEEDGLLIQLVEKYGLRKWSHIAQILPGRIGKQCRERWHNHLRPDIKKDTWSEEEDKILIQAHAEIGNKWAEIAKKLPGRTENSIKNHWNATKRRQYSKRKCRSKYPRGTLLQEYIKSLNLDKNPPIDYRRKSSAKYANVKKNKTSSTTSKVAAIPSSAQSQNASGQFCPSDNYCLVPNCDFNNEVLPDFCFDENLFQEGCSIDSLLDDMPFAPTTTIMDDKNFEGKMQYAADPAVVNLDDENNHIDETEMMPLEIIMASMLGVEVKKELDLVEMVSQVNEIVKC